MRIEFDTGESDLPTWITNTMTAAQKVGRAEDPDPDELLRLVTIVGLVAALLARRVETLEAKLRQ
jgi:hypothetical protein